jgi:two-component system LytT family sensor kinase
LSVSSFSDRKFKIAFVAWWAAVILIYTVALTDFGVAFQTALADAVTSNVLLAATCLLISNNMRYYLPQKEKYWYLLIISLGLSAAWLFFTRVLLWFFFTEDTAYLQLVKQSSVLRYGVAFLMVGCMAMMSLSWYTQQEQQETDARKRDAEKLAKDAELYKLRQQLQPHFLFNSLNSISALTGNQPEKARHMIQQLSDFLRGTLRKDEMIWTSLHEELQHLQLYLDIEKVRFGYRLNTIVVAEESVGQMKLPSMLLQPLVENAIKFGLYDTIGDVTIRIKAARADNALEVTVENPFDLDTPQTLHGTGFGLSSVRRRLFLLFARHDLLQTITDNNYFITRVTIPQVTEKVL